MTEKTSRNTTVNKSFSFFSKEFFFGHQKPDYKKATSDYEKLTSYINKLDNETTSLICFHRDRKLLKLAFLQEVELNYRGKRLSFVEAINLTLAKEENEYGKKYLRKKHPAFKKFQSWNEIFSGVTSNRTLNLLTDLCKKDSEEALKLSLTIHKLNRELQKPFCFHRDRKILKLELLLILEKQYTKKRNLPENKRRLPKDIFKDAIQETFNNNSAVSENLFTGTFSKRTAQVLYEISGEKVTELKARIPERTADKKRAIFASIKPSRAD